MPKKLKANDYIANTSLDITADNRKRLPFQKHKAGKSNGSSFLGQLFEPHEIFPEDRF